MSDQRKVFEEALEKDPYDQTTRWVFADWLEENGDDDGAKRQRDWTPEWQRAWDFMAEFAKEVSTPEDWADDDWFPVQKRSVEDVLAAGHSYLDNGKGIHCHGFDTPAIAYSSMDTFWKSFQVLTGRDPQGSEEEDRHIGGWGFVSCSC